MLFRSVAHLVLLGHIVKVQPLAVGGGHNALGPQDGAVFAGIQGRQNAVDIRLGELLGGLRAPAGEHLVGVVVMVVAGALRIVALALAVMMVVMLVLVVFMVMLMIMVVMMVLVLVLILVMIMIVMMVMLMRILVMLVMMVMMLGLLGLVLGPHLLQQLVSQGHLLHGGQNGLTVQLVPGGGQDGGGGR